MSKLKDIPFGSEIPTFDNDGYIALSSGLKGPSGSAIIETCSGLALFIGEACYASCAYCADTACCACCAWSAGTAERACCAGSADIASYACCAGSADNASYACVACCAYCACEACCAGLAGDAFYLSYCDLHLSPSYCSSFSAYLLV